MDDYINVNKLFASYEETYSNYGILIVNNIFINQRDTREGILWNYLNK